MSEKTGVNPCLANIWCQLPGISWLGKSFTLLPARHAYVWLLLLLLNVYNVYLSRYGIILLYHRCYFPTYPKPLEYTNHIPHPSISLKMQHLRYKNIGIRIHQQTYASTFTAEELWQLPVKSLPNLVQQSWLHTKDYTLFMVGESVRLHK